MNKYGQHHDTIDRCPNPLSLREVKAHTSYKYGISGQDAMGGIEWQEGYDKGFVYQPHRCMGFYLWFSHLSSWWTAV